MDYMICPTPVDKPAPFQSNLEQLKQELNFEKKSDKNHQIKNSIKNLSIYIILNAKIKDDLNSIEYEKKFYYDELKNNKYLSICDSIDEVFEQINLELNKNIFTIKEAEKELKIIIPIEGFVKLKEISFELPLKIKNNKEIIQDLMKEIAQIKKEMLNYNDLKKEIEEIKKELIKNNNLNIEIEDLKKDKELKNKIDNLEKEKNELNEKMKIVFNTTLFEEFDNSSSIIQNKIEYQRLIIKWIQEKVKKNIKNINLIFKMSKNGTTSNDFHNYCDDKGSTLSIIQTSKDEILVDLQNYLGSIVFMTKQIIHLFFL